MLGEGQLWLDIGVAVEVAGFGEAKSWSAMLGIGCGAVGTTGGGVGYMGYEDDTGTGMED